MVSGPGTQEQQPEPEPVADTGRQLCDALTLELLDVLHRARQQHAPQTEMPLVSRESWATYHAAEMKAASGPAVPLLEPTANAAPPDHLDPQIHDVSPVKPAPPQRLPLRSEAASLPPVHTWTAATTAEGDAPLPASAGNAVQPPFERPPPEITSAPPAPAIGPESLEPPRPFEAPIVAPTPVGQTAFYVVSDAPRGPAAAAVSTPAPGDSGARLDLLGGLLVGVALNMLALGLVALILVRRGAIFRIELINGTPTAHGLSPADTMPRRQVNAAVEAPTAALASGTGDRPHPSTPPPPPSFAAGTEMLFPEVGMSFDERRKEEQQREEEMRAAMIEDAFAANLRLRKVIQEGPTSSPQGDQ